MPVAAAADALAQLQGTWQGEGELLGRPAQFRMRWSELADGRYVRLEFENRFASDAEAALSAVAYYPTGEGQAAGWWFDSRGERLSLQIDAGDSRLAVEWSSPTERGRTIYQPTQDGVLVVDSVVRGGVLTEFARARYTTQPDPRPEMEGWITTEDGARMHYRVVGEGEQTVVTPMEEFLTAALEPLARDRRLVFFDPLGRGASDATPLEAVSEDRQLRDLEALRVQLGLERFTLLGWSGLGKLVARYAIAHPERVERILLVSPVGPSSDPWPLEPGIPTRDEKVDRVAYEQLQADRASGAFGADSALACRTENLILLPTSFVDRSMAHLVPDVCRFPNEWPERLYPYFGALLGSFGTFDHRPAFRALDIPTLVIHGREDGIAVSGGRAWVEGQPGKRMVVLSPAGHFPFLEAPWAFLDAAEAFLAGDWPENAELVPAGSAA